MKRRTDMRERDDAVSPVIGVMLMLVVTIIIAAVVSTFAGGLASNAEKAPAISMKVSIANTGSYVGSHFNAEVLSVSKPIPTKDLKLVTSWKTTDRTDGSTITGGMTSYAGERNDNMGVNYVWNAKKAPLVDGAPFGYGTGVFNQNSGIPDKPDQQFGNYTLSGSTTMNAVPAGLSGGRMAGDIVNVQPGDIDELGGYGVVTPFEYTDGSRNHGFTSKPGENENNDQIQAVLGKGWENLRMGDVVHVKLIHMPSGKAIYDEKVVVE